MDKTNAYADAQAQTATVSGADQYVQQHARSDSCFYFLCYIRVLSRENFAQHAVATAARL